MTTEAEKIKKGCGIVLKLIHKCGEYYAGRVIYCDVCQARLSQYKSDLQQELEFLEMWHNPDCKITPCNCCSRWHFWTQERIKLIKKELEKINNGNN